MNGPLIFTIIQLIKALECTEEKTVVTSTNMTTAANETLFQIERQILAEQNATEGETPPPPPVDQPKTEELSDLVKLLKKHCACPCSGVKYNTVCGQTTKGLMKTFDSQCHLICYNQCEEDDERYAIKFYGTCPLVPLIPSTVFSRKNADSVSPMGNRRTDDAVASGSIAGGAGAAGVYESFITPLERKCNCAYCQRTKFIRLNYYPICAERVDRVVTFDSWCHFDCENKCAQQSGYSYLYKYRKPCRQLIQIDPEDDFRLRVSPSLRHQHLAQRLPNHASECKAVCAKNSGNEYLSFRSRCHMHCHNLCKYEDPNDNYMITGF